MNPSLIQSRALKNLLAKVLKLLDPPPMLNVWKWGELRRRMGKNVTAKPGGYLVATTPYSQEPQESFTDIDVQTTVMYWAKRLGKTENENNLAGSVMEQNPRNILVVYPTLDSAKKWSKQFFMPMVRSTPVLRAMIRDSRAKESNNTILTKEFPGGTISAIGANSPSGFRQVQAPVVICDEIDAMENGPEGDPVTLAFGRAENYPDSIQVVSSTATKIRPPKKDGESEDGGSGSRIHDWWLKSDQRKWFVKCPDCGGRHVMDDEPDWDHQKLRNLKWPIIEIGKGVWEHRFEEAYYECPDCHSHWDDGKRLQAINDGIWKATAKFNGIRGYWLSGFNTTFAPKKGYKTKLHQFAQEFYDACVGGETTRIVWLNTFLCKPLEQKAERIEGNPLLERREKYTKQTLPVEIAVIGCAVDVQGDRLECDVIGMGEGEETWGVEFVKLYGDPEKEQVWTDLKNLLSTKYTRADGAEIPITCAAIDLGHKPQRVRRFIKKCGLPRVYGVYGTSGKNVTLVVPKFHKHYRSWSYSVATDLAKDIIFARVKLEEAGPRYMHWPIDHGYDKSYFDGLTVEERRFKYVNGHPTRYYHKPDGARNEPLDLRVYFLAAMDILKPNIRAIAENLLAGQAVQRDYVLKNPNQPAPTKTVPTAPARRIARKTTGSWR